MNFYQQLQSNTEHARQSFLQAPIIQRCFNGDFNLNDYIAFLQQAYHHVKFTVPLLMATGAKLSEDKELVNTLKKKWVTKSGSLTTLQPVALIKNRRG
jgi:thiaminase